MKNNSFRLSYRNKVSIPKSSRKILNIGPHDDIKFINNTKNHSVIIKKVSSNHRSKRAPKILIAFDSFMAWGFVLFSLQSFSSNKIITLFLSFLSSAMVIFPLLYPKHFKKFSIILSEIVGIVLAILLLIIFGVVFYAAIF